MQEKDLPSGDKVRECVYSPHSMRATTANLLLDSSVGIESVQELVDHQAHHDHPDL
jgi:site-specific recombinase XerC